jgi:hypothetical protein
MLYRKHQILYCLFVQMTISSSPFLGGIFFIYFFFCAVQGSECIHIKWEALTTKSGFTIKYQLFEGRRL